MGYEIFRGIELATEFRRRGKTVLFGGFQPHISREFVSPYADAGRLLDVWTGNNTDATINFVPTMGFPALLEGYARVMQALYAPEGYYRRVDNFLLHHRPLHLRGGGIRAKELLALAKSMLLLGVMERGRLYYWRLFFWSLFRRPRQFPTAITCAVYGYHFRRVLGRYFSRVE
jgi:hypothetical protein